MACPDCGLKFMEFRAGGRLGCPLDYCGFLQGALAAVAAVPRRDPPCGQGGAAARGGRRSGSGCAPGCARPSRAKIMKKPRGCETCSARRMHTHDSGRPDENLRRVAARHRARERHRDVLADPAGPQPRRLSRSPIGPAAAKRPRSRHTSTRPWRTPSSICRTSTSTCLSTLDRQFLVERQIISRELADQRRARAAWPSARWKTSPSWSTRKTICASSSCSPGFRLPEVWDAVNQLDDLLEEQLALRLQPPARLPDRLPDQRRHRHSRRRDAPPARPGPDQADRQGLSRLAKDQPGRPRPLRRGEPGLRRLLPDLQPADPGQERARADQDLDRRRAPGPPVRAGGPAGPA